MVYPHIKATYLLVFCLCKFQFEISQFNRLLRQNEATCRLLHWRQVHRDIRTDRRFGPLVKVKVRDYSGVCLWLKNPEVLLIATSRDPRHGSSLKYRNLISGLIVSRLWSLLWIVSAFTLILDIYIYMYRMSRGNVLDFGRMLLKLKYTDLTQLVINKCVTAVILSNFCRHYLRNRSTSDMGVLGYIGVL